MSFLLSKNATILCTHGGTASPVPSNQVVKVSDSQILVESDVTTVAGCPFNISGKPSPCIRIEWASPAQQFLLKAGKPLTQSSIGKCISAEGAPQGIALIVSTQIKAQAR